MPYDFTHIWNVKQNNHRHGNRFVVARGGGWEKFLSERGQNLQISSYKISVGDLMDSIMMAVKKKNI